MKAGSPLRPPGPAVCDRCGLRLNPQTHYEGGRLVRVSWHHGYDADHDPRPRPVAVVDPAAMMCDFCGRPGVTWSFNTERDIVMHTVRDTSSGPEDVISTAENGWAACDGCGRLVTTRRRNELFQRAVRTLFPQAGDTSRTALRAVHDAFFAAGPLPATRIGGGPTTGPVITPGSDAGSLVDYLIGQIEEGKRRLIAAVPEVREFTRALALAALADRPPEVPAEALASVVSRPHGGQFAHEAMMYARLVATSRLWRQTRVAYAVDTALWSQLGDLDRDFRLPLGVLRRLPHPNPFVTFPEPLDLALDAGQHRRIVGAFVAGQHGGADVSTRDPSAVAGYVCGTHSGQASALKLVLCGLVYDADGAPVMVADGFQDSVFTHLSIPAHGEHTVADLVDYALAGMGPSLDIGSDDERADVTAMLRRALSLLVYLCSRNADLHERPAPRPRTSKKARRAAQRRRAPAQIVEVGYRIGAQLRAHVRRRDQPERNRDGATPSRTVAPHIRRMHPHWYRVGPGRTELELKWLDPIPVNMSGQASQTTVIPVPPEHPEPRRHLADAIGTHALTPRASTSTASSIHPYTTEDLKTLLARG